jgi:hypothetical protein
MKTPRSHLRDVLPFATPPRIRIIADTDHLSEALALADDLEACGADAEVRIESDSADDDHVHPDAYIVDRAEVAPAAASHAGICVAVMDRDDSREHRRLKSAGFDLAITRPLQAEVLMRKLSEVITS